MRERVYQLNVQNLRQAFKACWDAACKTCLVGEWELVIRERKRSQE